MEYRSMSMGVRAIDGNEEGVIEGMACRFGVMDDWGTIFDRGCFKKTLRENPEVVMLWSHDRTEPIGLSEEGMMRETGDGLLVRGRLNLDIPRAQQVYSNAKKRIVRGISIGFRSFADKTPLDENKIPHFREVGLLEWSPLAAGMNAVPGSEITKVRTRAELDAMLRTIADTEELASMGAWDRATLDRCIDRLMALRSAEPPTTGTRDADEPPIAQDEPDAELLHSLMRNIAEFNRNSQGVRNA